MSGVVYVVITYNDVPDTGLKDNVCLKLNYSTEDGLIFMCYSDTTPIDISDNGTYNNVSETITKLGLINLSSPYLTSIFGTYNSNDITNYTINNNNVTINSNSILATLTFSTEPCCFSEGTNILGLTAQLKEEYRLVQDLMIGDFVKSYLHGYRKVSRVLKGSFVNNPKDDGAANCMYIMRKKQDNGLIEDLTLTRNHGVLVEKLTEDEEKKIDKNNLPIIDGLLSIITAQSDKFEKVMDSNVYKYYHFSLDGDGDNDRRFAVWVNGILVETPSNNMMDGAINIKPLDF
jgi:hypothetical protein